MDGALRPAKIEDLLGTAMLLHSLDIGYIVILAHLCPRPGPEFRVVNGECFMLLAVLSATIIADPDIIASLC